MSVSLILDTSSDIFSISLFENGNVLSTFTQKCCINCSNLILDFIIKELDKICIKIGDIDYLGVSTGPGSYTGIRVGVSFCLGVCEALKKPLININLLHALEFFYHDNNYVVYPVINAKNNNIYTLIDRNVCKINVKDFKNILSTRNDCLKRKIISSFDFLNSFGVICDNIENVIIENKSRIMFKLFDKKVKNNEFCDIYNYNIDYFDS